MRDNLDPTVYSPAAIQAYLVRVFWTEFCVDFNFLFCRYSGKYPVPLRVLISNETAFLGV